MTKRYYIPLVLITVVIFLALGYFAYKKYIVPIYLNNSEQTKTIRLDQEAELVLTIHENQRNIHSLELEISGNSSSNLDVLISNPERTSVTNARIKGGEIDYVFVNDWHSDSCILYIKSDRPSNESLTVVYRFIGFD